MKVSRKVFRRKHASVSRKRLRKYTRKNVKQASKRRFHKGGDDDIYTIEESIKQMTYPYTLKPPATINLAFKKKGEMFSAKKDFKFMLHLDPGLQSGRMELYRLPEREDNPFFIVQSKHEDNPFFSETPNDIEEHSVREKHNEKEHYDFNFPENIKKFKIIKKGIDHLIQKQNMENANPFPNRNIT